MSRWLDGGPDRGGEDGYEDAWGNGSWQQGSSAGSVQGCLGTLGEVCKLA